MDAKQPGQMASGNFFRNLINDIKLIIRLIGDSRVNPFLKILPLLPTLYLVFPDMVLGPLDDGLFLWLGGYLFIELSPPEVVQEHRNHLLGIPEEDAGNSDKDPQEIIDVSFKDTDGD